MGEAPDKKDGCEPAKKRDFPIRDLPDMRNLRKAYLKKNDKPIGVDSADNPIPHEDEEDFGLKRSTPEEAREFLEETLRCDEADDPLTEFLNDE